MSSINHNKRPIGTSLVKFSPKNDLGKKHIQDEKNRPLLSNTLNSMSNFAFRKMYEILMKIDYEMGSKYIQISYKLFIKISYMYHSIL